MREERATMRNTCSAVAVAAVILGIIAAGGAGAAARKSPTPRRTGEAKKTHDKRIAWWREARFGMFIHWGLYSVLGGEWKGKDYGKEMGGASAEWIMLRAPVPTDRYAALARQFNPVKFNAAEWVRVAKDAGMKYMVITAKHHDGFCMFDTDATDYNIVDATPFGRDPIRELADECRRQGVRFGVYYSHSKDWYHRGRSEKRRPTAKYVNMVKAHLRELLTNYGDIAILWFDMGGKLRDVNETYGKLVRSLQPNTLISGRLQGSPGTSDYQSMRDRTIPSGNVDADTETPMTVRLNWGYDRDDDNWKSVKEILELLSLCVCRGGNMLLNVGPTPAGTLVNEEIERLAAVGRWMKVNGKAIYGTVKGPFPYDFEWGAVSARPFDKAKGGHGRLYLHVLKWNPDGIEVNGLTSRVTGAYLLADKDAKPLAVEQDTDKATLRIGLPAKAPDPYVSVVVVETEGKATLDPGATGKYHWNKL